MNNMLRVRFKRGENTKFVSHLDLMKSFDRAIRRANLPIAYSQGFNPHPSMVFGLPLSVGVTSESEFMDIELTEKIEAGAFIKSLNEYLPEGLECLEAEYFEHKGNIMKEIAYASYDLLVSPSVETDMESIDANLAKLIEASEIIVKKEGKNGIKDMDIRPLIYQVAYGKLYDNARKSFIFNSSSGNLKTDGEYVNNYIESVKKNSWELSYNTESVLIFSLITSAGSKANLKPELFIAALAGSLGAELKVLKIHRTGLFIDKEGEISSPI